jgi:BMFP domain-containing protein YqiC
LSHKDVEGLISIGAPADEYEAEAKMICDRLGEAEQKNSKLTTEQILSIVEQVWREMFDLSPEQLAARREALQEIAVRLAPIEQSK